MAMYITYPITSFILSLVDHLTAETTKAECLEFSAVSKQDNSAGGN